MTPDKSLTRRSMIKTAAFGAGAALAGKAMDGGTAKAGCGSCGSDAKAAAKDNDFYDGTGKFLAAKAKAAYFAMMKRFGYPIPPALKKGMWVLDFALGDFVNVGMAGIFWWNSKEYSYFGHEIILLPGQMIVEHAHVKTKEAAPKMEAWHVRYGMIYTLGEGKETKPMPVKLPASQAKFITVRNCKPLSPGEVSGLNRPAAKHFMIAGPEGAIVTEYATYHDAAALRFTNPGVKL